MKQTAARISVIATALSVAASIAFHPIFLIPALVWGLLFMALKNGGLGDG